MILVWDLALSGKKFSLDFVFDEGNDIFGNESIILIEAPQQNKFKHKCKNYEILSSD